MYMFCLYSVYSVLVLQSFYLPITMLLFFLDMQVLIKDPFENLLVKSLYDEWLEKPGSEKAKKHMHTEYHPMVKSVTAQLHNW